MSAANPAGNLDGKEYDCDNLTVKVAKQYISATGKADEVHVQLICAFKEVIHGWKSWLTA